MNKKKEEEREKGIRVYFFLWPCLQRHPTHHKLPTLKKTITPCSETFGLKNNKRMATHPTTTTKEQGEKCKQSK